MKHEWSFALAILAAAVLFYAVPVHRQALVPPVVWWQRVIFQAETNWVPDLPGLNVAVLGPDGSLKDSQSFDTYTYGDGAFASYIAGVTPDTWVIVTARGEATNNLQEADLAALEALGGSRSLAGRRHWAYILVGRSGLGPGAGLEELSAGALDMLLQQGREVAGKAFPLTLRLRSAGFYQGDYASVRYPPSGYNNLWAWLRAAVARM